MLLGPSQKIKIVNCRIFSLYFFFFTFDKYMSKLQGQGNLYLHYIHSIFGNCHHHFCKINKVDLLNI